MGSINHENEDIATKLRRAFPSEVEGDVDAALQVIPDVGVYSAYDFDVLIAGQEVRIPGRVILEDTHQLAEVSIGERPRIVLACLLTRHRDGFVRERYVHHIACAAELWVAPNVLGLFGERVCPIIEVLIPYLNLMDPDIYAKFAVANREFVDLTRQRAISHWLHLHRRRSPSFREYPGFRVLEALGLWPKRYARRLLAS